jgi:2-polyprenyl-3-methyl-5-hydroxy-6-metoxy-1,4-benzoquinol methylase
VDFGKMKSNMDFSFNALRTLETMFETDFLDVTQDEVEDALGGPPDLVVSFEVLEHMPPKQAVQVLELIRSMMHEDSTFIVSTPNFDEGQGAASNHVCEWTYEAKEDIFGAVGFDVQKRYGVFASQRDYKDLLGPQQLDAFKEMRDFLPACALATVFAPMFPKEARNALHVLTKGERKPLTHIPNVSNRAEIGSFEGDWSSFDAHIEENFDSQDTEPVFW